MFVFFSTDSYNIQYFICFIHVSSFSPFCNHSHTNHHNNRIISSIQKSNHKYTNNTNFKPHRMSLLKPNNNEAELTEEFNSSNRLHCSSLTHSTSSSPTKTSSHPSTTQQQQHHHHHDNDEVNCDDDDDTMKCLVSINPDPWITMEPGKQQRKDLISKCKRSLSSELDTNKLKQHPNPLHYYPYHHGTEFPTNNNTSANNQSIAAGCGGGGGYQSKFYFTSFLYSFFLSFYILSVLISIGQSSILLYWSTIKQIVSLLGS